MQPSAGNLERSWEKILLECLEKTGTNKSINIGKDGVDTKWWDRVGGNARLTS
jgi:hypothetical protein